MAFINGRNAVVVVASADMSAYTTKVDFKQKADVNDVTTFGKSSKVYLGGLKDGTCTLSGVYDNTAVSGPAAKLRPLLGTAVTLVWEPEGITTGKPVHTVGAVLAAYDESAPVADTISWTCELQLSDDITTTSHA